MKERQRSIDILLDSIARNCTVKNINEHQTAVIKAYNVHRDEFQNALDIGVNMYYSDVEPEQVYDKYFTLIDNDDYEERDESYT